MANDALVMTGVEFLLSMVESRWASRNGDRGKTDPGDRTHKELDKIDQQIARLQDAAGPDETTQQEIQQLRDRVEALRKEMTSHFGAWEKTELARHPQRPYPLDYIERIFTDWSEIHGDRAFGDDPGAGLRHGTFPRRGSHDRRATRRREIPSKRFTATSACLIRRATARLCA